MIHDYGPGNRLVSFHIEMDAKGDVMKSHDVIDNIERDLLVQDGMIATIHYDPVITGNPHTEEIRGFLQQEAARLEPRANIHDLRIVPGPTHTNVIFDCAVPAEYVTDKQHRGVKLVSALRAAVQQRWPDHSVSSNWNPITRPARTRRNNRKEKRRGILWTTTKPPWNCMPKAPEN